MNVTEIKSPQRVVDQFDLTLFLAGAIDMGESEEWQSEVVKHLENVEGVASIGVFNPRRSDWDSQWKQEINNEQFFEQVSWELTHIENCDVAVVYFTKDSKAPITLMELGKLSEIKTPDSVVVFCPDGYHRKGNVDILCYRKGIPVHNTIESFYAGLDKALGITSMPIETTKNQSEEKPVKEEYIPIELFEIAENAKLGDENILVVSEYDEVNADDSCIMGNVTFKGKQFFSGICKEDGSVKTNLYFKKDGQRISEKFTIMAVSEEYPEEQIILKA